MGEKDEKEVAASEERGDEEVSGMLTLPLSLGAVSKVRVCTTQCMKYLHILYRLWRAKWRRKGEGVAPQCWRSRSRRCSHLYRHSGKSSR